MLEIKACPKCDRITTGENDACPFCGYRFERQGPDTSPVLQVATVREKNPAPEKKPDRNGYFLAGIVTLVILALIITIPTKTITKDVPVSYQDTENYTEQEPYTVMDISYETVTWQEVHVSSVEQDLPENYYWKKCGSPCRCTHYTTNPQTDPSYYCDSCVCPNSGVYEQSRSDPKYQWVTKYREVTKTRNVTRTRLEPEPVEVNWIFGFGVPWTFRVM